LEKPFGIDIYTPRQWLGTLTRPQRKRFARLGCRAGLEIHEADLQGMGYPTHDFTAFGLPQTFHFAACWNLAFSAVLTNAKL